MLAEGDHVWRLNKNGLGLSCTQDGLFLGDTPLLECRNGAFVPRAQHVLERVLSRGFEIDVSLDRAMQGLATVASALNAKDLCRARIAAVHLCIPDLPDVFARIDMQLEDIALSLDRVTKATAAGDWDPEEHPRTGTAPNPGWFAPTDGGSGADARPMLVSDETNDDGRLHLPPGERDDEAGDLLEWIANAKPEDAQAIRAEIKRIYFDVGDTQGAAALNGALSDVLENQDPQTRQSVLDNFEIYTRTDPAEIGQFRRDLVTGALLGPLTAGTTTVGPTAEAGATEEGADAAQEPASEVWGLGWGTRGRAIHDAMGGNLPWWFKGIDDFRNGLATSFKTIDLNAATYQDADNLASAVNRYINNLVAFNGKSYAGWEVKAEQITGRALNLIVPRGSMTETQRAVIDAAVERAKSRGISLFITPF